MTHGVTKMGVYVNPSVSHMHIHTFTLLIESSRLQHVEMHAVCVCACPPVVLWTEGKLMLQHMALD